jgi:hypothetical protein
MNVAPVAASIVEVRFESMPGGSLLHLDHRGWEEFGADEGAALRADYESGWDAVLAPFEARAADV